MKLQSRKRRAPFISLKDPVQLSSNFLAGVLLVVFQLNHRYPHFIRDSFGGPVTLRSNNLDSISMEWVNRFLFEFASKTVAEHVLRGEWFRKLHKFKLHGLDSTFGIFFSLGKWASLFISPSYALSVIITTTLWLRKSFLFEEINSLSQLISEDFDRWFVLIERSKRFISRLKINKGICIGFVKHLSKFHLLQGIAAGDGEEAYIHTHTEFFRISIFTVVLKGWKLGSEKKFSSYHSRR